MADLRKNKTFIFTGGMNKDAADAVISDKQYRHAENLRILSDKDGQSGSLGNIKGNIKSVDKSLLQTSNVYSLKYDFPENGAMPILAETITIDGIDTNLWFNASQFRSELELYSSISATLLQQYPYLSISYNRYWMLIYSKDLTHLGFTLSTTGVISNELVLSSETDLNIIGYTYARNDIVLFTCPNNNVQESGQIWKLNFNEAATPPSATIELLYNNKLNFSLAHPIFDAKGSIENDECKKVYFTDNNNYLRSFNYADANAFAYTPETLDILGDVNFSYKPLLDNMVSGNLPCGRIQYAYSLYNKYGSETNISPLSNLIHLAIGSDFDKTDYNYYGEAGTENSGKGVSIKVRNIDKRYKYIKVYSFLYKDGNSEPETSQVFDEEITSNTMVFVDDGTSIIRAMTVDELSIYNKIAFRCKSFDTKNNLLITGNTSGELFDVDFDARAYRFNLYDPFNPLNNYAELKENDYNPHYAIDINLDANIYSPSAPPDKTLNTINVDQNIYKYKKGTKVLGGSGPNVNYEIGVMPLKLGALSGIVDPRNFREEPRNEYWGTQGYQYYMGEDFVDNKNSFCGYASPFNSGQFTGYRRNETYRFGIVFYNKKGIRSSVKWIGDIKMPDIYEETPSYTLFIDDDGVHHKDFNTFFMDNASDIYSCPLYVKFDITIPDDIKDEVSGYEIVRVQRKELDKTIRAQGLVNPTQWDTGFGLYYMPRGLGDAYVHNAPSDVIGFASPEGIFNQNLGYKNGDKLQLVLQSSVGNASTLSPGGFYSTILNGNSLYNTSTNPPVLRDMSDNKFAPSSIYDKTLLISENIGVNPTVVRLVMRSVADDTNYPQPAGSQNIIVLKGGNNSMPIYFEDRFIANIVNDDVIQYGGSSYGDRILNSYITTGSYANITDSSNTYNSNVFGGDTFITMFDYQLGIFSLVNDDSGFGQTRCENIIFPVESEINLSLRTDKSFLKTQNIKLQERAIDFAGTNVTYTQEKDLYQYNPAYSRDSEINLYFSENNNIFKPSKFDCRIRASERKKNGDINDAWTQFTSENYLDINTSYGEITKVVNFKNNIYVFQNNAIGVSSVDDRSIVKDTNANDIVLGNGGVLTRHDYINNTSGTSHQASVILSDSAIYYFDSTDRQIKVLTEQEGSISDNFGLKSYMYNTISGSVLINDNPHMYYGVNGYYDDRYNEVVMTFHNGTDSILKPIYQTIVFNELFRAFSSFYTFSSPIYIKHYSKILSVYRDVADDIYLHNFGEYNTFYGNRNPSVLKLYFNPDYPAIKVFDSINMDCEISDNNINIYNEFFDLVRVYNEYQNSDYNTFRYQGTTPGFKELNYARRERNYTFQIPRNIVDANITTNPDIFDPINLNNFYREFKERMRSKGLTLDFVYNCADNKKLTTNFIAINYRMSYR